MNMQILRFDEVNEAPPPAPRHEAVALTGGGRTAEIRLGDQLYTLRITRAGKLLLTK